MSTAPAPNAGAPPGMCPGVATLAGGGGAGGSDAGAGGNGNGNGGGGGGDGKGGNGDGKGAGGCGPGSGGGCPNPAHGGGGGTHAGDPIDPLTGRVYTIPQTDLPLVGPLVLALQRAYSSFAVDRDVGLGWGWNHSLGWAITRRRNALEIAPPFGVPVKCDIPAEGAVLPVRGVGLLRMVEERILMTEQDSGFFFQFEPVTARALQYRLTTVFDEPGNAIVLGYDEVGRLTTITDSAGRRADVRRNRAGLIEGFELATSKGRTVAYRRYEYNDLGEMAAAIDGEGHRVSYLYDAKHRLVEETFATGKVVHFRYDKAGRCVESWVDYGGAPDPALADDVPTVLADGETKARGMLHVVLDYGDESTIVYDSRQSKRFDRNDHGLIDIASGPWVEALGYDGSGHVTAYSDPTKHVTRYERDSAGRLLGVTDPAGHHSAFRYDDSGRLIESVDELGVALRHAYDASGNLKETWDTLGVLLRCTHDARGLRTRAEMPNGAVTQWEHDAEGNLTTLVEPHGKPRRFEVDDIGRVLAFTDEEGYRTVFHYDSVNALRGVELPNGGVSRVELDAEGRPTSYQTPDGGVWRLSWGGHGCVHALAKPTGEVLCFRYDREGNLVRIVNERGEVHHIERDAGGRVISDRFFDGREYRYKLDAAGRLVAHHNGAGERTDLERDACGRVVKRAYDDRTADTFAYDPVGRLVSADNGAVACAWEYDARGNMVRERRAHQGRTVTVESAYNAANQRIGIRTNFGHAVRYERDAMGQATRVVLVDGSVIERTFDALGREVLRSLPGGGHVICRYDGVGAMLERRIMGSAAASVAAVAPAPAWVGPLPQGTTFAEGFVCSVGGDMLDRWSSHGERERFAYDAAGRVVARTVADGELREAYAYEGTGLIVEPAGPVREYGAGGALLVRGKDRYSYDGESRRTSRATVNAASPAASEAGAKTKYQWDGRGMLAAVALPDGSRVEHVYDTQGRRALKRVRRPDGARQETRFSWSGDDMIHEITWFMARGVAPAPVRACAFVYDDDGSPLAHRETVWIDGAPREGEWVHYALGPGDMPELLVGGEGSILARMRATVWGRVEPGGGDGAGDPKATTPLRFPGQYHDQETGLHYNRYRFYDPEVGLYINADPLGLQGGLGAFEYARGMPFRITDPDGLVPVGTTVTSDQRDKRGKRRSSKVSVGSASTGSQGEIHPIVSQAFPPNKATGDAGPQWPGSNNPRSCGEPRALSKHIEKWEDKIGRKLDPNDKKDQKEIRKCLGSITVIKSQEEDGTRRAPCPNCSQLLANLNERWGAPRSRSVRPGHGASGNRGASVNFTPPMKNWKPPPGYNVKTSIGR